MAYTLVSIAVLSIAVVAPVQAGDCAEDMQNAAMAASQAATMIVNAFDGCTSDTATCFNELASAALSLADMAGNVTKAEADCASGGDACAEDMQSIRSLLNEATGNLSKADSDCTSWSSADECIQDILQALDSIMTISPTITKGSRDCFEDAPLAGTDNCIADIKAAASDFVEAAFHIKDAVGDCIKDWDMCKKDISAAVTSFGSAAKYIAKAVTDCGKKGGRCTEDIAFLESYLRSATFNMSSMGTDSTAVDVKDSAARVTKMAPEFVKAAKDCRGNVAVLHI